MMDNDKKMFNRRDSTDTIYNMIDSIRKINNLEARENVLMYFTGFANGFADGFALGSTKKE